MERRRDVPSHLTAVRRALDEQYTDAVRTCVHGYALHRAALIQREGAPAPEDYAEDLVHDAIAGLWLGTLPWNPAREHLLRRLCQIIYARTSA